MLRASVAAEKAGVPAVSIVATQFMASARAVAKGLGLEDPAIAEYPGVPMIDSHEELRSRVVEHLLPQILRGWGARVKYRSERPQHEATPEPDPRDIVFRGSFQEVQDFFEDRLWSDGLPVAPPTVESVDEFLAFTDRAPDEVIGVCPPEQRQATVWNVAVNGVMAGCRPEYMPILLAVVEAVTDPGFFLEDAGSTPGWEPVIVLNGPIIKELDFNCGTGVMRVGRRANTSIGRFLRLFMRNVPGQRIPPGGTDKATIGITFNVVLAENEDAVASMGWQPFSVDQGFGHGENVVTVQSAIAVTQPTYTAGKDALNHADIISEVIGQNFAYRSYLGIRHGILYPLIVMSPSVAKAIADQGWKKDDLRMHLYRNTLVRASLVEKYAKNNAIADFDLRDLAARGLIAPHYHESDDPDRLVRVFQKPEWIGFVVAGDPGRNQSRGYIQNHRQGVPVSKKVRVPHNWKDMLAQRRRPRAWQ